MAIVSDIPPAAQRIRERVRANRSVHGGALEKVQQAATEIDRAAQEASTPSAAERETAAREKQATGVQKVEVVQPPSPATISGPAASAFSGLPRSSYSCSFWFISSSSPEILDKRKLVKIGGRTLSEKKITVQILDDINPGDIQSFMRVQVFTSFLVAVGTGIALWWFGVEHPIVWVWLAGIFNSIPYLGPVIVTGGLGLVTFMQFDDLAKTAYVCGVAFAITSLEGFLLTPMLMGRAAQMNPVAIFVGGPSGSWIWGIWGTVLAVPMLMMLKAICDHVEDLRPIGELLGE